MNDPLAQFRRKPIASSARAGAHVPDGYLAFATKDRVERVKVRRANAPTRSPRYLDLWDVSYDGEFGTNFVAVFAYYMVMVRGRNLQGVISALQSGMCDFIQEFDPDVWAKPQNEDAPFIESIDIAVPDGAPSLDDLSLFGANESGGKPH
jgi:hypothetical protein